MRIDDKLVKEAVGELRFFAETLEGKGATARNWAERERSLAYADKVRKLIKKIEKARDEQ